MKVKEKTKEKLMSELAEMRQRIAVLEKTDTRQKLELKKSLKSEAMLKTITENSPDDVTGHREAEKALKENKEQHRSLFVNMLNGFAYCKVITDKNNKTVDWVYLEVNDAFEKLTGLKKEDIIGKRVTEAIPGIKDSHPELFDIYGKTAFTGIGNEFTLHFKPLDIWLHVFAYCPKKGYFAAVFENITDRKQAEEALKESESRFRTHLENLNCIAVGLDKEWNITFINPALGKLLGLPDKEIIGKNWIDNFIPVRQRKEIKIIHKSYLKKELNPHYVSSILLKSGEERLIRWANTALSFQGKNKIETMSIGEDITELRKTEETLKEKQRLNELLLNSLPYPAMIISKERIILTANRAAVSTGARVGDHCWRSFRKSEFISEEDGEYIKKHKKVPKCTPHCYFCLAEEALSKRENINADVNAWGKTWDTYWVPLDKETYLHYAIDITARKEAEGKIKMSKDLLSKAEEIAHLGNWVQDLKNNSIVWSDETYRIFGYRPQQFDVTFDKFLESVHPDDRNSIIEKTNIALASDDNTYKFEYRIKQQNGSERILYEEAEIERDHTGKPLRTIGIIQDITERKRLQEKEMEFGRILETSLNEIYIFNSETLKFIQANQGARENLGYSMKELCEMTPIDLKPDFTPDSFEKLLRPLRKREKNKIQFTTVHSRKNGSLYPVEVHLQHSLFQSLPVFIAIILDITERKRHEEQSKHQQEQLDHADRMSSLGTLVSGVGHEINNPNNSIRMNIPLIEELWKDAKPLLSAGSKVIGKHDIAGMSFSKAMENFPKLTAGVSSASRRIEKIVQGLRDFARMDSSGYDTIVDIKNVLQNSKNLTAGLLKKKTSNFSMNIGDIPPLEGNRQKLEQVFINLITNACHALTNQEQAIEINASHEPLSNMVILEVRDQGKGMDKETLRRVMEPFFTTKQDTGGTGLGVSISYGIIKKHGGSMEYASKPGNGTTVTVSLPVGTKQGKNRENLEH